MAQLRRLRSLILPKSATKNNPGSAPSPILLKTSQLRINDEYQRSLSRDSGRLAVKIATDFDWELYHLLVVSPLDEVDETTGLPLYEVLDGQHTAIGAITNGNIRELWCWPGRVGESLKSRADSFQKLNTQRTQITPVELFWARVTAGNEDSLDVVEACNRTGATIVKRPKPYGDMKVGETICTAVLERLAGAGGVRYVERILKICTSIRLAPISQDWIMAMEELLFKPHSICRITGVNTTIDMLIEQAVDRIGVEELERKAKLQFASNARSERRPVYFTMAYLIKQEVSKHVTS